MRSGGLKLRFRGEGLADPEAILFGAGSIRPDCTYQIDPPARRLAQGRATSGNQHGQTA